jgi:hypothetical protein
MSQLNAPFQDTLEELIDQTSLHAVLDTLTQKVEL